MGFDPKAYLAENEEKPSSGGFDPKAYLSEADSRPSPSSPMDRLSALFTNKGRNDLHDAVEREANAFRPVLGSMDDPHETDIFKDDADRTAAGFGDTAGVGKMLLKKGFVNFAKNKNGDLVARDAQGNWHKDASGFLSHPVNWAESNVGPAIPFAAGVAGGILGNVPGAAAGGAAGEAARIAAGKAMGVYDGGIGDAALDAGKEGVLMGAGEGLGRVVEPAVRPAISALGQGLKTGVGYLSQFTSGVPREAVERLIERPNQVLGATGDRALEIAENARNELMERNKAESKAISEARDRFATERGTEPVDTGDIVSDVQKFLEKKGGVDGEQGALSPKEVESINDLIKTRLQNSGSPQKTARQLQNLADFLDSQVKTFDQSKLPGSGDTAYQAQLRRLYGQVKAALHNMDPEGLGAADKRFSQYATEADRLGRLENPDQMEGFVNNYYGRNKSLMRQSAENLIPNSVEDIADLGANRAFSVNGPAGSHAGLRNMATTALESAGLATHNPLMMAAGAAIQPQVQKQVIGQSARTLQAIGSAPWFQSIAKDPALVQSIANPELKALVDRALTSPKGVAKVDGQSEGQSADQNIQYAPEREKWSPLERGQSRFLKDN